VSIGYVATAAAVLAHSRGDHAAVLAAVEPVLGLRNRVGIDEPGHLEWPWLYVEALVRLGRVEDAERVLRPLEHAAQDIRRPWPSAAAARVRGLVEATRGRVDAAVGAFESAAALATSAGTPFELGLIHQQHGEVLRRLGRRRAAFVALDQALAIFTQLGATPFVEASHRELAACGFSRPLHDLAARPTGLTPQELTVARLVRAGLRNRDIAAELFISTKTVEFHLRNVFLKLDVSSRTQLVAQLAPD
jgi:DNA-binding CsgD family transcriptional regulator